MNDVGGQQLAVGVARFKQNMTSFTDLVEWTRKYPAKDTGAPRNDPGDDVLTFSLSATWIVH